MTVLRFRQPRKKDAKHLAYIRQLPCLICGRPPSEAAHVRFADVAYGKRPTGAGEKPDDGWTVPLCADHHRLLPESQHAHGERGWWREQGIDPLKVARHLQEVSGDIFKGTVIVTDVLWRDLGGHEHG